MKILKSERQGNQYALEIEESIENLEKAIDKAFHKLKNKVSLPGFRKGKITRSLFEGHFGKDTLIQEGISDAVNNAYFEAIQELNLFVIDHPRNLKIEEYKEAAPLLFSCEVDVKPEVSLGKYTGIEVKRADSKVSDEALDNHIDKVREGYSEYVTTTERPAQKEDILRCQIQALVDGVVFEAWTRQNVGLKIGAGSFGEEFDLRLTGVSINDPKAFSITYPDDFQVSGVAGKAVQFKVEISEIREKKLPELDDIFVQKVSQTKTVEAYRSQIRDELEKKSKQDAENRFFNDLMEGILKEVKIDLQPVLIEREIDNSVDRFEHSLKESGLTLDQYLGMLKQPYEQFRETYRDAAAQKLKTELILEAIAKKENLKVEEQDILEELKKWNSSIFKSEEDLARFVKNPTPELTEILLKRKTLAFLESNAKIV